MPRQTHSAEETQRAAKDILKVLGERNIICLSGQMGAGKTTLVQGIAKELGINAKVTSPTFVLIRRYFLNHRSEVRNPNFSYLWHVDLYRLDNLEQVETLGLAEIWEDKDNLVVIEWPEKIKNKLPKNYLEIQIKTFSETIRQIEIKK